MKSLLTPDRNLPSLSQPRPNDNPERAYNLLLEESQKAYEPCGKSESIAARPQVNSLIKDSIRQQFQQPAVSKLRSAKRRGQRELQYFEISVPEILLNIMSGVLAHLAFIEMYQSYLIKFIHNYEDFCFVFMDSEDTQAHLAQQNVSMLHLLSKFQNILNHLLRVSAFLY